jgi:hypothetical protein
MTVYKYQGDYDEVVVYAGPGLDGESVTEVEQRPRQFVLGVPARDLTEEEWNGLTEQEQQAATNSGLYKPMGAARQTADSEKGD